MPPSKKRLRLDGEEAFSPTMVAAEYHRSEVEAANIMKQWRSFRSKSSFTDLSVLCGQNNSQRQFVRLHRLVLAGCSSFMAEALKDREESTVFMPEVDHLDFLNLVQILYGERAHSNDTGYPSQELLTMLKITNFPALDKGTPYADSGTESASADQDLGSLFRGPAHEALFVNDNLEEVLHTLEPAPKKPESIKRSKPSKPDEDTEAAKNLASKIAPPTPFMDNREPEEIPSIEAKVAPEKVIEQSNTEWSDEEGVAWSENEDNVEWSDEEDEKWQQRINEKNKREEKLMMQKEQEDNQKESNHRRGSSIANDSPKSSTVS